MKLYFIEKVNELCSHVPASWESGYRTPTRNKTIGGAVGSLHQLGLAQDLIYDSVADLWQAAQKAIELGFGGIEVDLTNSHLHVDFRDTIWHVVRYNDGSHIMTISYHEYCTRFQI